MSDKKHAAALPEHPLVKSYEPKEFEAQIYEFWEKSGSFDASDRNAPGQKSFCIVIPPPNITGILHMGHALTMTIEDILIRWRRMCGDNTLWLPGTDHAGIATQTQVEKALYKEGSSRQQLGREKFLDRVWKWKNDHHEIITSQLKRFGSSFDWKRERFTLDEGCSVAVREVFVRLYEEGLIYRGERIINWDTAAMTALSDLEVIPTERKGFLWHIRYYVIEEDGTQIKNPDGTDACIVIATTRPETLLGDTAVAIHPEDERYKNFHGKFVKLPLLNRKIPIIVDEYVDRKFGTGALKITPAHDFNDYEIGKRHNLPMVLVMGKDGKITAAGGPYAGAKFQSARERIIGDLKGEGLLVKTEDYVHHVGLSQRTGIPAEPIVSEQWFVKIGPLAKPAIEAVENGKISFLPKNWEKTYFEWMYNIRDWCISRQLWWGHRIPAWYCGVCQSMIVARETPEKCEQCGADGSNLKQDEDVLDTWFSSALWPFSTLGWPEKTQALKTFYPTAIMETGFDIIFFWVARMIMMGIHFMGDVPFSKIYLHAMVRDEKGDKMSKSKGNTIDPLVMMDEYGTDALRFTLAIMAGQGRDVKISKDRVEGYKAFCNKLWNAVKYYHFQNDNYGKELKEPAGGFEHWIEDKDKVGLSPTNRWILSRLQALNSTVKSGLEGFELNVSTQAIYDFVWHELCDWYIEFSKLSLREGDQNEKNETLLTLRYVLEKLLRMAHPFIPYATEELWQSLPWKKPANTLSRKRDKEPAIMTLMIQNFPEPNPDLIDKDAEKTMDALKGVIDAIRAFRGENNISPKVKFPVTYVTNVPAADSFVRMHNDKILELARISSLEKINATTENQKKKLESVVPLTNPPLELRISLEGLVNVEEEVKRLQKEISKVNTDINYIRQKLSNESFMAKAPGSLVEKERSREKGLVNKLKELETSLSRLSGLA